MSMSELFFGEQSLSKVAAVYDSPEKAREAAHSVHRHTGLETVRLDLIEPGDPSLLTKIEPETQGIFRTMIRAHVSCGLIGWLLAVLTWAGFMAAGATAVVSAPGLSWLFFSSLGLIGGLLVGGLLSLRPDHQLLINKVRRATQQGRWALVGHPQGADQHKQLRLAFADTSPMVLDTL